MDSGSTDQTCAIAERMGAQIVHRPDWRGFGPQRNHQIAACQAEYIFFLDADEEIGSFTRTAVPLPTSTKAVDTTEATA